VIGIHEVAVEGEAGFQGAETFQGHVGIHSFDLRSDRLRHLVRRR